MIDIRNHDDDIWIGVSKKKSFFTILIVSGLIVVTIFGLVKSYAMPFSFNRTFLLIGLSLLLITFGLGFYIGFRKLFDKTQGLLISNKGIDVKIGPNRGQTILWSDIKEFDVRANERGPLALLIFVKRPEDFIDKTHGLQRFLIKMNYLSHKTPISLTANWLDCRFEDLIKMIGVFYDKTLPNKKYRSLGG